MVLFLSRVGSVLNPLDLENIKDRNACLGMLHVLVQMFQECRWEALHHAAKLLNNCIDMLQYRAV